jgi:hypothetical protein
MEILKIFLKSCKGLICLGAQGPYSPRGFHPVPWVSSIKNVVSSVPVSMKFLVHLKHTMVEVNPHFSERADLIQLVLLSTMPLAVSVKISAHPIQVSLCCHAHLLKTNPHLNRNQQEAK